MNSSDIRNRRFEKASMGGYRPDEISAWQNEAADYARHLEDINTDLEKKIAVLAEKIEEYREDESAIRAALIDARKMGDKVIKEAREKAEAILADASAKAHIAAQEIHAAIDRENKTLIKVKSDTTDFKKQLLLLYRRHIDMLEKMPEYNVRPEIEIPAAESRPQKQPQVPNFDEEDTATTFETNGFASKFSENITAEPQIKTAAGSKRSFEGLDLHFGEKHKLTRNE
jgi:cell division initiation protein